MSPVRLIIIGILLYIGYRLIFGGRKKKIKGSDQAKAESGNFPVEDVLVEDPVCHNLVPKQQAICLNHNGETIYFCSQECCSNFVKEKGES